MGLRDILAGSACQNAVASALSTRGDWNNLRQYLREWLYDGGDRARPCRAEMDVSLCFAPLPRWVLAWWRSGRLAPAVDPTLQGDDTTAIVISVVYRGCAIPVAWRILRANQRGAWMDPMVELLRELAPAVPREMTREMTGVALCDRVDVPAGPADPAAGVFQGIAQAVVETPAVELGLADMVAPAPVGAADSRVQGFQDTEPCPGFGRSFQSSPVRARMRAPAARFVAPQDFPAALRIRPWVSISSASAWSWRASRKISSMRLALVVMVSFYPRSTYPRSTISSARIAKAGLFPGKRPWWSSGHKTRRSAPVRGRHVDSEAGSRMLTLRPVDMVGEALKARAARQPVPAQLRRALGQAGPASFLETPRLDSGGIEDALVTPW